jgi:hypothetical protein
MDLSLFSNQKFKIQNFIPEETLVARMFKLLAVTYIRVLVGKKVLVLFINKK